MSDDPSTFITLSTDDGSGWHNGGDHKVVAWDATHVAAIFSDARPDDGGLNGASVVMLTLVGGVLTMGNKYWYLGEVDDSEDAGYDHDTARIGDLLVQTRRSTGTIVTLSWDEGTDTWAREDIVPFAFVSGDDIKGARIVPWTSDTMLLVVGYHDANPPIQGAAMFAHWTGSTWEFGPPFIDATDSTFGHTGDYIYCARVTDQDDDSPAALVGRVTDFFGAQDVFYATLTGSYPSAPILTTTAVETLGTNDYYPWQWWAAPGYAHVLRAIPVENGTTTPIIGGSDDFDWAYMPVTLDAGVVAEGALVNLGHTDDWYDIWMTQHPDGDTWGAWPVAGHTFTGPINVKNSTDDLNTIITDPLDGGVYISDFTGTRCIAPLSTGVVAIWMTDENRMVRATWIGTLATPSGAGILETRNHFDPGGRF